MIPLASKDDIQALKSFALTMIWAFPLFFAGILPWLFGYAFPLWPFAISLVLLAFYFLKPQWIYYPYRGWMFIAGILGWVNTRLILGVTFYGVIFPIGLVLKMCGALQYRRSVRNETESFYVSRQEALEKERLEQPF